MRCLSCFPINPLWRNLSYSYIWSYTIQCYSSKVSHKSDNFSSLLTCIDDYFLSLKLFTLTFIVCLDIWYWFFTTGKSIKSSWSHSTLISVVSRSWTFSELTDSFAWLWTSYEMWELFKFVNFFRTVNGRVNGQLVKSMANGSVSGQEGQVNKSNPSTCKKK